ncbi:MAG: head-tail adaptor protein [Candidatus Aminicenantes bacterium]|nr:head-tail adaptor protein [Candidatus Aminicenantes bacterium]
MSLLAHSLAKCGQAITFQTRDVKLKNGQAEVVFADIDTDTAIIKTVSGVSVFDDTNTEVVATHKLTLAYRADITAENWVLFGTKRIKILTHDDCAAQGKALILMCTERGEDSKVVNQG